MVSEICFNVFFFINDYFENPFKVFLELKLFENNKGKAEA